MDSITRGDWRMEMVWMKCGIGSIGGSSFNYKNL